MIDLTKYIVSYEIEEITLSVIERLREELLKLGYEDYYKSHSLEQRLEDFKGYPSIKFLTKTWVLSEIDTDKTCITLKELFELIKEDGFILSEKFVVDITKIYGREGDKIINSFSKLCKRNVCGANYFHYPEYGTKQCSSDKIAEPVKNFILPSIWHVLYKSREEFDIIDKHYNKHWSFKNISKEEQWGYCTSKSCNNWCSTAYIKDNPNSIEISFSDWEKYVAKTVYSTSSITPNIPEKWYIKCTEENKTVLFKWRTARSCTVGYYVHSDDIGKGGSPDYKGWSASAPVSGYTEITFEQFKKYVLKETALDSKSLPTDWYIKVTKENHKTLREWRSAGAIGGMEVGQEKDPRGYIHSKDKGYWNHEPITNYSEITFEQFKEHILNQKTMRKEEYKGYFLDSFPNKLQETLSAGPDHEKELKEWLEVTKKLNLSFEDLRARIGSMNHQLFLKLSGDSSKDKAKILFTFWEMEKNMGPQAQNPCKELPMSSPCTCVLPAPKEVLTTDQIKYFPKVTEIV